MGGDALNFFLLFGKFIDDYYLLCGVCLSSNLVFFWKPEMAVDFSHAQMSQGSAGSNQNGYSEKVYLGGALPYAA